MEKQEQQKESIKSIPQKIIGIMFSERTQEVITILCKKNDIKDPTKIEEAFYLIGLVLLKNLSPKAFLQSVPEKLQISTETANNFYRELYGNIFFPIEKELKDIYGEPIPTWETLKKDKPTEEQKIFFSKKNPPILENEKNSSDNYREGV